MGEILPFAVNSDPFPIRDRNRNDSKVGLLEMLAFARRDPENESGKSSRPLGAGNLHLRLVCARVPAWLLPNGTDKSHVMRGNSIHLSACL